LVVLVAVELLVLLWGDKLEVFQAVVVLGFVDVVDLGVGWDWLVGFAGVVHGELAVEIRGGDVGALACG